MRAQSGCAGVAGCRQRQQPRGMPLASYATHGHLGGGRQQLAGGRLHGPACATWEALIKAEFAAALVLTVGVQVGVDPSEDASRLASFVHPRPWGLGPVTRKSGAVGVVALGNVCCPCSASRYWHRGAEFHWHRTYCACAPERYCICRQIAIPDENWAYACVYCWTNDKGAVELVREGADGSVGDVRRNSD